MALSAIAPDDHDDGEKVFLSHRGRFNGEDVIDIICQRPAIDRFVSRHMYNFFVADEPPVPQWPFTPPRNPDGVELLSKAYFDSEYDIRYMLEVLFKSNLFRSEESWYAKVKSPAELVAGELRLTGGYHGDDSRVVRDELVDPTCCRVGVPGRQVFDDKERRGSYHSATDHVRNPLCPAPTDGHPSGAYMASGPF